jgi:hypothetical protein
MSESTTLWTIFWLHIAAFVILEALDFADAYELIDDEDEDDGLSP